MSAPAAGSDLPLLSLRGISKAFAGVEVLHDVSLDLFPGQVLAVLGENGAGKSTLMNIASGSLPPDHGSLHWNGSPIHLPNASAALRLGIAHIHQELSTVPALSVMENLFLDNYRANRWGFIDRRRMLADARGLLARVGGEQIDPERQVSELGVADQQIIEIAKALSGEVRLLIMDEPTSSLTAHEVAALLRLIRELRDHGVSLVFISHRLEEALAIADRAAVLRDGRLVSDRSIGETNRQRLIADMAGRAFSVAERRPVQPRPGAPVVMSVRDLTGTGGYGPFSFALRAGEVLGVFGLVSSGRTELLEMLCGERKCLGGTVTLFDGQNRPASPTEAWRRGIGILPEGRKRNGIFPKHSVQENIAVTFRNARRQNLAGTRTERQTARRFFERLGIRAAGLEQEIIYLSGGNQQKAILARCLAVGPRVLLLDEPTHGIDVRTKGELYQMIDDLAGQGIGIVMVSSEIPEILAVASTILVLARGKQTLILRNDGLDDRTLLEAAFASHEPDRGLTSVSEQNK
ncbi:MAG: sugar ABC transporter ATP-binding protein [Verrucomicrobia bacterium]|nr:sugar ABC transporter ATP-binding protein [Verrucomicrobiota bacterium]